MVEDVFPLPKAGQNHPFPRLLPPPLHIEDDLLNGDPILTQRSCKCSSCGEVCHIKASCVC